MSLSRQPKQYLGVRSINPPDLVLAKRAPTATDTAYLFGTFWLDTVGQAGYMYAGPAVWITLGGGTADVNTINHLLPTAGNIDIVGTAAQITVANAGSTVTLSIPAVAGNTTSFTSGSFITSSATLGTTFTANSIVPTGSNANIDLLLNTKGTGAIVFSQGGAGVDRNIQITNTDNTAAAGNAGLQLAVGGSTSTGDPYVSFQVSGVGASTMTMGLDNSASDLFVISNSTAIGTSNALTLTQAGALGATTSITAGTTVTATVGAITATNGNLVLGTAGNKIISTSVATTTTAGANSFGTVTLSGGTATVNTSAVTASSIIILTRQSVGSTGMAALGELSIGTISAGMSFDINAWSVLDATALATTDVSSIGWMIIN